MVKKAIYLAGGGARGAYQIGVLKAIHEITGEKTVPFHSISGVSIGTINAVILAENMNDFSAAVEKLEFLWSNIRSQDIFRASNYYLSKSVLRNLTTLIIKQRQAGFLLDTTPLREFIDTNINFERIKQHVIEGRLQFIEAISNCYETQQTVSFYQHSNSFEDWAYPRHASEKVHLTHEHVLASSALPLFFPTQKINDLHYGDGSIGLVSPLRGAIRFEAEKILILGTRQLPQFLAKQPLPNGEIGFAHILGNMLSGLFLDNLDRDIELVNRMNEIARLLSLWKKRRSPWRPVETLHLRPSTNISTMAQAHYQNMPSLLRFLLNILGAKSQSGDLLSFLLFEKEFTRELITLGYQDTINNPELIENFFS